MAPQDRVGQAAAEPEPGPMALRGGNEGGGVWCVGSAAIGLGSGAHSLPGLAAAEEGSTGQEWDSRATPAV